MASTPTESDSEKLSAFAVPFIDSNELIFESTTELDLEDNHTNVFFAKCRSFDVAVKVPKRQTLSKRELKKFSSEVEIMRFVKQKKNHKNRTN